MSFVLPEPSKKIETAANVEQCSVIIHADAAAVNIPSAIPNPIATIQVKANKFIYFYCQ
jgi:hypothetical protein